MRRKSKNNLNFLFLIIAIAIVVVKFIITYVWFFIAAVVTAIMVKLFLYVQEEKRTKALIYSNIDNMSGLDFEHYVQQILEYRGYDAKVTKASGDLGADIIATMGSLRYSVQTKRYSYSVDRTAVSDAVAAKDHYKCDQAMVITSNYFTPGAKELAKSTRCVLVDRDQLSNWVEEYRRSEENLGARQYLNWYSGAFVVLSIILFISLINGIHSVSRLTLPTSTSIATTDPNKTSNISTNQKVREYKTYTNQRFGYSIPIPADFVAEPEPANGDGRGFHSIDGKCELSVWGSHFPEAMGFNTQQYFEYVISNSSGEITYKKLGDNWFVVSGYQGDNIFYQKTFVGNDENSFILVMPKAQREIYRDVTDYLEKSFKQGSGINYQSQAIVPSQSEINAVLRRTIEQNNPSTYFIADSQLITISDGNNGWISALIGTRYPTADGYGKLVFFWHNGNFIGWDSNYGSIFLRISDYGPGFYEVSYAHYLPQDSLHSPSLPDVKVRYSWNGDSFSSSGLPPVNWEPMPVKYIY